MWAQEQHLKVRDGKNTSRAESSESRHITEVAVERLALPAEMASGAGLRRALRHLYDRFGLDNEAAEEFILAVSEAFSNAVRHGTARPDQFVETWIRVSAEGCRVTMQYPGEPFPVRPPQLPEHTSTNGRGRYLMSLLADRVEYEFADGMTRVKLSRRWK
jgi:serine/threonine-protein kinase RsbW